MNKISFLPFQNLLIRFLDKLNVKSEASFNSVKSKPISAEEDYIVTRVGYRSPDGDKIPLKCEKIFSVERGTIFRPFIFQHETDPNDIIGTASNDIMFGFQVFQLLTQKDFDIWRI